MEPVRRGPSTVVGLVGEVGEGLPRALGRSPNVVALEAPGEGLEAAIEAYREAAGRAAPYVLVAGDPLAEVAGEWRRMWDLRAGTSAFEERAGEALLAWRAGRFELPDYYVVVAREHRDVRAPHPDDLHLGVLSSLRPSRVVPVAAGETEETVARVLHVLASLPHGPWWPGLDRVVEAARSFLPTRLAAGGPEVSRPRARRPGRPPVPA